MKYKFIMENRKEFRLGKMCKVLEVSRSGYHNYIGRKLKPRGLKQQHLLEQIKRIFERSRGLYGSPRIYRELRKQGMICNKKTVARIMRINGIRSKTQRKYKVTMDSAHKYPAAENIVGQNFNVSAVNRIWVSDITYLWTKEGWLYLTCILDLCSRMIVEWFIDSTMSSRIVIAALKQAIIQRGKNPGIIFHSDRGSQYAPNEVKSFLKVNDMVQSMSRKGNCYDNAVMESFFHTLKSELIGFEHFQRQDEAKMKVFEYIEIFYNRQRSHSTIGYCSPFEFENNLRNKLVA